MMKTDDVRIDVKLNKAIWSKGIRNTLLCSNRYQPRTRSHSFGNLPRVERSCACGPALAAEHAGLPLQVPDRIRVKISRKANDDEDAKVRSTLDFLGQFCSNLFLWILVLVEWRFDTSCPCLLETLLRDTRRFPLSSALGKDELYSFVTVADVPNGDFHGLGTKPEHLCPLHLNWNVTLALLYARNSGSCVSKSLPWDAQQLGNIPENCALSCKCTKMHVHLTVR
eukprot:1188779-Prorocentrum_minimum.AAC.1